MNLLIKSGLNKNCKPEKIREFLVKSGEIIGIVGVTGSGKSMLINDIEQLAWGDTTSRRHIYINGKKPPMTMRTSPTQRIIAQLSQNMHFLTDMPVREFLLLHAKNRGKKWYIVDKVIRLANTLCGEKISPHHLLTILSGGQSRALMIADIALISNSPIVLIDEIENAGIKRFEALEILTGEGKIILMVTHDPILALMTKKRIVMSNGGMERVITSTLNEKGLLKRLLNEDECLMHYREQIRTGKNIL